LLKKVERYMSVPNYWVTRQLVYWCFFVGWIFPGCYREENIAPSWKRR
jgi:hypothetical protein